MKTETLAALQQARTERTAVTLATRLSDAAETMIYLCLLYTSDAADE